MINHFLLNDKELLDRYRELLEESLDIETDYNDVYLDHDFKPERISEYREVKDLILKRMRGED